MDRVIEAGSRPISAQRRSSRAPRETASSMSPPGMFHTSACSATAALQSDKASFEALHAYFLDRLVPVCARLLDAAAAAGEIRSGVDAYELMRGVGGLCAGAEGDSRYDARRMVGLLIAGLRQAPPA